MLIKWLLHKHYLFFIFFGQTNINWPYLVNVWFTFFLVQIHIFWAKVMAKHVTDCSVNDSSLLPSSDTDCKIFTAMQGFHCNARSLNCRFLWCSSLDQLSSSSLSWIRSKWLICPRAWLPHLDGEKQSWCIILLLLLFFRCL